MELKNKKLINYEGNYDYYKNELKKQQILMQNKEEVKEELQNKKSNTTSNNQKKNKDNEERDKLRKASKIEEKIYDTENKINEVENQMLEYALDYIRLNELNKEASSS